MGKRVNFIRHKSAEILLIDWSDGTADDILEAIQEAKRLIASRPARSVRTLTNVAGARLERRVTEVLKDYVAHNKPYVLAGAVVGLNELKTVVFNFVNRATGRSLRAMNSVEEAKEWLAAAT
ncbi:MAG TPA: hypothetical protein VGR02_20985 [Thermoanaerobaculia bacterium]|jgi:hypothetical protein|nr:hypothetical protein [Thermoanaerobaculia bacterium]